MNLCPLFWICHPTHNWIYMLLWLLPNIPIQLANCSFGLEIKVSKVAKMHEPVTYRNILKDKILIVIDDPCFHTIFIHYQRYQIFFSNLFFKVHGSFYPKPWSSSFFSQQSEKKYHFSFSGSLYAIHSKSGYVSIIQSGLCFSQIFGRSSFVTYKNSHFIYSLDLRGLFFSSLKKKPNIFIE